MWYFSFKDEIEKLALFGILGKDKDKEHWKTTLTPATADSVAEMILIPSLKGKEVNKEKKKWFKKRTGVAPEFHIDPLKLKKQYKFADWGITEGWEQFGKRLFNRTREGSPYRSSKFSGLADKWYKGKRGTSTGLFTKEKK